MRFSDGRLEPIWEKIRAGQRLDRDDGLALLESDDLLGVGRLADHVKSRREGGYFIVESPQPGGWTRRWQGLDARR